MLPLFQAVIMVSVLAVMTSFAVRMRVIDRGGALAAIPIGFSVLYFGSVYWFIILMMFFVIASLFSKYKGKIKQRLGIPCQDGGRRGWKNVLANGLPGSIIAIFHHFFHGDPVFVLAYTGSISFALSDTIATEVGLLSNSKPRSILTGKHVKTGQSGGITLLGEISAILAATGIGITCGFLLSTDPSQMPLIIVSAIVAGFVATNIDSLLGATIQAKYRCRVCKTYFEKNVSHCSINAIREKGLSLIDNNAVNLIGAIIGAFISASFILVGNA